MWVWNRCSEDTMVIVHEKTSKPLAKAENEIGTERNAQQIVRCDGSRQASVAIEIGKPLRKN
jgi:hypothetical protein